MNYSKELYHQTQVNVQMENYVWSPEKHDTVNEYI